MKIIKNPLKLQNKLSKYKISYYSYICDCLFNTNTRFVGCSHTLLLCHTVRKEEITYSQRLTVIGSNNEQRAARFLVIQNV